MLRQHPCRSVVHALAVAAVLGLCAAPARADPLQDMKAQVDLLMQRIAELERRGSAAASAPKADAVTAGATPGSFKLPGSDTSVTLGGYVKLDAIYSDHSAGVASTADQEYEAGNVPVGSNAGANERGQFKLHARQTRLFAKTATPTSWGDLNSHVEFDLFGAAGNESVSNSHGLRVRHAYGTLGHLLAGQTWTTFSDVAVYPETIDFGGPAGEIFARQAQVRWTQPFAGGEWAIALENPETVVTSPSGASFRADDDRWPDVAAKTRFATALGDYSIAVIARQLRVDSARDPASRDQRWAGAIGVNGVVPTVGKDDLRVSAYYGNAIGRYSIGFFSDGLLDASSRLKLPDQWLASAAYRHFWSPGLRSTIALSGLRVDNPAGTAAGTNRSAQSAHLNLIWSPVAQANFGVEYIAARREVEGGQSGRLNRLQVAAQYFF